MSKITVLHSSEYCTGQPDNNHMVWKQKKINIKFNIVQDPIESAFYHLLLLQKASSFPT